MTSKMDSVPDQHRVTVVVAPDSFKSSISATAAADALAAGWRAQRPTDQMVLRPIADGGEGTLDAFAASVIGSRRMPVEVTGPDDSPVRASWLLLPPSAGTPHGTGVVELASTSGIELLGDRRLPWDAHTLGFGEAIAAAVGHGVSRLVLGIGSSASTDGGAAMLTALGARLLDAAGHPIALGARGLSSVRRVDLSALCPLPPGGAVVLTDVSNPLLGANGAAAVFGVQKGFAGVEIEPAEQALAHFAHLLDALADPAAPGAGAAGGVGFALMCWGAELRPGAEAVSTSSGLADAVAQASVVITGEGSFDRQSAFGKAPAYVAELAGRAGVVAVLVAGRIADDADLTPFAMSVSLVRLAGSEHAALADPGAWLREAGAAAARGLTGLDGI